jgi:NAD(P)-dependent dehydrogenase (short-subunit alcohol dehydrogenase family)
MELAGKVAVVTGAGSGIGRALALSLADEGMHVAVLDIDKAAAEGVAAEIVAKGANASGLQCDVSLRQDVRDIAARVFREFGPVHVLCNNAGVTCFKSVPDMTDHDWDWMMSVDLMGVIYGYQAYVPQMIAQGAGHVVNTSSGVGVAPDMLPDHTAYACAKGGVVALSASLRREVADKGVGVSVLCPGPVRTDILASGRRRQERFGGPHGSVESVPGLGDPLQGGMDPMNVGRAVVDAIKANRAFVFPDASLREVVADYCQRMLADF